MSTGTGIYAEFKKSLFSVAAAAALSFGLFVACAPSAYATEVEPLTLDETVQEANAIVIGQVINQQTRWGDASQRWMVTDYTFQIEEALYANGAIQPGQTITLSYWGGTIGEETQKVADLPYPTQGKKYMVMLRPDWKTRFEHSPLVGMWHGMFQVVNDRMQNATVIRDAAGEPLSVMANGQVVRAEDVNNNSQVQQGVTLQNFKSWLSNNIQRIKQMPARKRPQPDPNDPRLMKTIELPVEKPGDPSTYMNHEIMMPASQDDHAHQAPVDPSVPEWISGSGQAQTGVDRHSALGYSTFGYCDLNIVVNPLPGGDAWSPWSPEDQYQMAKWNYYADVFRVMAATGNFAWNNNRFDITGWPSSATMQSQYGSPWGSNTLGITYYRLSGSKIIEADIALNPAYGWTMDDEWFYNGGSAWGYRQTMIHELGHMWGLDHQFNFLSLMNYAPKEFRAFAMPYMDDAEAIRARYPSRVQNHTDLAVYLYRSNGFQNVVDATYPSVIVADSAFTINDFHIENVGTATIGNPTLEWYLTKSRNYNDSYYYLKTQSYGTPLGRFNFYNTWTVGTSLTVPYSIPGGYYYLNAYIRNDEGAGQASFPFNNNMAWTRTQVLVKHKPISYADSYSVNEDNVLSIGGRGVLANDIDGDGNTIYAYLWTNPAHGSVSLSTNGSFVYTPHANFNGSDSFTYYSWDGEYASNVTTVYITVNPVADGDVNRDGCINDFDLAAIIFDFGRAPSGTQGATDLNRDGIVNDFDLAEVIFNFGVGCR